MWVYITWEEQPWQQKLYDYVYTVVLQRLDQECVNMI
jgi:hypothetical protein